MLLLHHAPYFRYLVNSSVFTETLGLSDTFLYRELEHSAGIEPAYSGFPQQDKGLGPSYLKGPPLYLVKLRVHVLIC